MKTQTLVYLLSASLLLAACAPGAQAAPAADPKSACPVSQPDPETSLFGDEDGLQVFIANDGIWEDLPMAVSDGESPNNAGFGNKVFWKYPDYSWTDEPMPEFSVTGEQLDGDGSFEEPGPATNAYADDLLGSAILTGVNIPNRGCWQITGHYRDATLSFVVWVGASN